MTWYVHRNNDNSIASMHREMQPGYAEEALADDNSEIEAMQLLPAVAQKCKQIEAIQHQKELIGFEYANARFEYDTVSQGKIGNMTLRAFMSLTPGTSISWVTLEFVAADNNVHVFENAVDFIPFAQNAANAAQTTFAYRTTLKQACRAANNIAELDAVDIYNGWPEFNAP